MHNIVLFLRHFKVATRLKNNTRKSQKGSVTTTQLDQLIKQYGKLY